MLDYPQPDLEQVAQRLHLMDVRIDQQYPGYLVALEQLRQPQNHQEGDWTPLLEQRHCWKVQEEQ